ncbi:hypothetical protein [Deinococcus marmoris]|uniref:hypothetical protein n=1 Tax=Deinococcus marmoris TaxID=249408 RepID=UPI0012DE54C4|nr:hypothetical protein [Deinococcus marmoris]
MTSLLVVVQRITFEWGKEARGGVLAARRNQAPQYARLPTKTHPESMAALVHTLSFSDADAFAEAREQVYEYISLVSARPAEVELKLEDGKLQLIPYASHPSGRGKVAELSLGQTAKYEWNQRIVLEHTWRYTHTILNIGLTQQPLQSRLFFSEPDFHESKLAQMY